KVFTPYERIERDGKLFAAVTGPADVLLSAGKGADGINVDSTLKDFQLEADGGYSDDKVAVGSANGSLDSILGMVIVDGEQSASPSGNKLGIIDSGSPAGHTYDLAVSNTLNANVLSRDGAPVVAFRNFQRVYIDTTQFDDVFHAHSALPGSQSSL